MIYHPSVCSKPSELGGNVRGLWASFAAAIVGALECGGGSMSQKKGGEPTVEAEVYGEVSVKRYFRKGESFLLAMLVLILEGTCSSVNTSWVYPYSIL